MKTKNFDDNLKKRLNKAEIAEIEKIAELEHIAYRSLQADVAKAIKDYMEKEKIGFNELVRRLDISPTQVSKIQKGEANLTLASIAHIFALLKRHPRLIIN